MTASPLHWNLWRSLAVRFICSWRWSFCIISIAKTSLLVQFEALTAVVMKSSVFWDIMLCSPLKINRCFGGTLCFHTQGRRISHARNQHEEGSLLTYLRSWALLEKPPIVQPLKNFPAFYGSRRFITVFTRALHWSLSWARSTQSTPSHPVSLRSILILSTPPTSWSS
jgi:hypothetical protein